MTSKKLFISGVAALSLALSVSTTASVSAHSGNNNRSNPPVAASQCDHPGYRHFGFNSKKACTDYVGQHRPGQGNGNGYGGNGGSTNTNIFVQIGNVVNGAVNVTINFVTNIFR